MELKRISFSNNYAYNICSDQYKKTIVDEINRWVKNPFRRSFDIYHHTRHFKKIVKTPQFISTKSIGNSYFLFLTQHIDQNGKNVCFFVDRKIINGYEYPRIIFVHYRFSEELFTNTLLEGDLIKTSNGWKFLLGDIHCYKNKRVQSYPFVKRMAILKKILHVEYTYDPYWESCPIRIKNYIPYNEQSKDLILEEIESKNYPIQGILFTSSKHMQPTVLIHLGKFKKIVNNDSNENIEDKASKTVVDAGHKPAGSKAAGSKPAGRKAADHKPAGRKAARTKKDPIQCVRLLLTKTGHYGVYQLYCAKMGKIVKHSIARVNGLDNLDFVINCLNGKRKSHVECEYNCKFKKFVAVKEIDPKISLSEYTDILEFIKLKTKSS